LEWTQNKNRYKHNVTENHALYDIYQTANVLKCQKPLERPSAGYFKDPVHTAQ